MHYTSHYAAFRDPWSLPVAKPSPRCTLARPGGIHAAAASAGPVAVQYAVVVAPG